MSIDNGIKFSGEGQLNIQFHREGYRPVYLKDKQWDLASALKDQVEFFDSKAVNVPKTEQEVADKYRRSIKIIKPDGVVQIDPKTGKDPHLMPFVIGCYNESGITKFCSSRQVH